MGCSLLLKKTLECLEKMLPPLVLESKLGFANSSVYGGLDLFIEKSLLLLREGIKNRADTAVIDDLKEAFANYSYLNTNDREALVKNTIERLQDINARLSLIIWDLPVSSLAGVGAKRCEQLQRLGIESLGDLFSFLPRYYDDRRNIVPIAAITPDFERGLTIKGKILHLSSFQSRKGFYIIRATISDGSGSIDAVWFNQRFLTQSLKKGMVVFLQGLLNKKAYKEKRRYELSSPLLEREGEEPLLTRRLAPIYSVTKGLTQKEIHKIVKKAREEILPSLKDPLPPDLLKRLNLLSLREAIEKIHDPKTINDYKRGRERLAFQELLILQLLLFQRRMRREKRCGIRHSSKNSLIQQYLSSLPFSLTRGQERVWQEIALDMEGDRQMFRLLQGDVGSGKTVIAALSLLKAIEGGYQGALMAPTEILAEQHYLDLKEEFQPLGIEVGFLSGGMKAEEIEKARGSLRNGSLPVVIGTHSLFQEGVSFKSLGLVIIDEQHRFGVRQRSLLLEKGSSADLLVMTATPIPRSLAMTLYGDLDLSIIDGLPPKRRPIETLCFDQHTNEVRELLLKELHRGYQVYYVCPFIQESQDNEGSSVVEKRQELAEIYQPFSVAMLHGAMKREEKQAIMQDFLRGQIHILVATTVIEVGVHNPKATMMVIEEAHRFGLSQLHQLRGRVGRGERSSTCLLLGRPATETGEKRLAAMLERKDGFKVAEEDLKIRGPGDFLGERQHGIPAMRIANLISDTNLLLRARELAENLVTTNQLEGPSFLLLKFFLQREGTTRDLARVVEES